MNKSQFKNHPLHLPVLPVLPVSESGIERQQRSEMTQKLQECTNAIAKLTSVIESRTDRLFDFFDFEGFKKEPISQIKKEVRVPSGRLNKIVIKKQYEGTHLFRDEKIDRSTGNEGRRENLLMGRKVEVSSKQNGDDKNLEGEIVQDSLKQNGREEKFENQDLQDAKNEGGEPDGMGEKDLVPVQKEAKKPTKKHKPKEKLEKQPERKQKVRLEKAELKVGVESASIQHEAIVKISSVLADYKDNFITVKMIDLDRVIRLQEEENNLPDQSNRKLGDEHFNSEFARWVANMFDSVCKSSFYGFVSKDMDKNSAKVYFSRNCLYNLILLKEQLMRGGRWEKEVKGLVKMFNSQAKETLGFLKLKYPQQEKVSFDQQVVKMMPSISADEKYNQCMSRQFYLQQLNLHSIKQFINKLINETKEKFQIFKYNMEQIFPKYFLTGSQFYSLIGSKLRENTPKYTQEEIKGEDMEIKSGEILRIIIKWIENLEEQLKLLVAQKKEKDRQEQKANQRDQQFDIKQLQKSSSQALSKFLTSIMNQYSENYKEAFNSMQENEFKTNLFASVSSIGLSNTVVNHLIKLVEQIKKIKQKYKCYNFKIFDLFRGKCSGSYREIREIYDNIKSSKVFEIIQIKNRIDTPNRDFLINMTMKGTVFVCELQLHINTESKVDDLKQHKRDCEIDFNHFLYELQRSTFGPLAEMVSVYTLNSDLPGFFSIGKLNNLRSKVKRKDLIQQVNVSEKYEVEICNGKTCYPMIKKQKLVLYICDYCCKISQDSSINYWNVSDGIVCEVCVLDKLNIQDKKRFFFKQYSDRFEHLDNLDGLKKNNNCVIKMDRTDHKMQKCLIKVFDSWMLISEQGKRVELQAFTKNIRNKYLFRAKQAQYIQSIELTQQLYNRIRKEDIIFHNLHTLPCSSPQFDIFYIQNQQGQRFILELIVHRRYKDNKQGLLEYLDNNTQNNSCTIKQDFGYHLYRNIPLQLKNNLMHLKIDLGLTNFPILNVESLQTLQLTMCYPEEGGLQYKNLSLNRIQSLNISIQVSQYSQQNVQIGLFNIGLLRSAHLHTLNLDFQKFKRIRVIFDSNSQKQGTSGTSKKQMVQSLPSLSTLHIKTREGGSCEIDFTNLEHSNLESLTTQYQDKSPSVINLSGSKLYRLKLLTIQSGSGDNLQLKGFQSQKDKGGVDVPRLQQVTLNGVVNSNIKYLPMSRLVKYLFVKSQESTVESANLVFPIEQCNNLQELELSSFDNFNKHLNLKTLFELQRLDIIGYDELVNRDQKIQGKSISQCLLFKELYPKGLKNLKRLTLCGGGMGQMIRASNRLELSEQLDQLETLSILDYFRIEIRSELRSLRQLKLETLGKQINLSSIASNQLQLLKLINQQNQGPLVVSLESNCSKSLKTLAFDKMQLCTFEGMKWSKAYFWNLQQIMIEGWKVLTKDLDAWTKTQEEEVIKEIQSLYNHKIALEQQQEQKRALEKQQKQKRDLENQSYQSDQDIVESEKSLQNQN